MPGTDGFKLAREIFRIREKIPVILCTGFSDTSDNELKKGTGIKEIIIKPVSKRVLASAIRRILDGNRK